MKYQMKNDDIADNQARRAEVKSEITAIIEGNYHYREMKKS